jgi:mono/diheme cytochrome c family protein
MASNDSTWHVVTVKHWILLGFALAACSREPAGGSVDGAQIYASVCAACHGPRGTPTESMAARLGVRDLASPELRARITPALVEVQVREGSANKLMPAFAGALSDEQIRAVSSYVASPELLAR